MEITAEPVAELLCRMLGEGHGLDARLDGTAVSLPAHRLRVAVGTPDPQPNGQAIRVPIGIAYEPWGELYAWDQTVGVGREAHSQVGQALDAWLHNVFSVFAAMAVPHSDLAERVYRDVIGDGTRTADVYYGALGFRDFGGLSDELKRAASDRPPSMVLVEELFNGYALPDRPVWLYTFCASMPSGRVTEVILLNDDASAGFPRIADHLPWEGHGSVKSWVLVAPRPLPDGPAGATG